VTWRGEGRRRRGQAQATQREGDGADRRDPTRMSAREEREDESGGRHNSVEKAYFEEFNKRRLV
jgi:hypothetical protein